MSKKLNNEQANMLFDDVIGGEVKRFGNYVINGYSVTIYRKTKNTAVQRNKAIIDDRKERGVCVDCEKRLPKIVRCPDCLKKNRKQYKKRVGAFQTDR